MKPKIRVSLSVVNFKEKAMKFWGLEEWQGKDDPVKEVLFFGLYQGHDYDAWYYAPDDIIRSVFWCGSDILNTMANPEFQRRLKLFPAKHYCETKEEQDNLKKIGIEAEIVYSFLDDIESFPFSYKQSETPHVWMCAHPNREVEYGVDVIVRMAEKFPTYTFHVYGIYEWNGAKKPKNVMYHGSVPEIQLNEEVKNYQCGFRGNTHEGMSEVPIKATLMGQYAITKMKFDNFWNFQNDEELIKHLENLAKMKNGNVMRKPTIAQLNNFPWVTK
jgi:hypothetical protein